MDCRRGYWNGYCRNISRYAWNENHLIVCVDEGMPDDFKAVILTIFEEVRPRVLEMPEPSLYEGGKWQQVLNTPGFRESWEIARAQAAAGMGIPITENYGLETNDTEPRVVSKSLSIKKQSI